MLFLPLILLICATEDALGTTSYPQLVNVYTANEDFVRKLESSDLVDVWSKFNGSIQIVVESENEEEVKSILDANDLRYEMVVENLLDLIQAENEYINSKTKRGKRSAEQMDWTSYHKLEDIEGYMGWLNATSPGLVTVFPVATTFEGRMLYVVRVSDPSSVYPKKKIWIEGGIHAREWISPAVTTFLLHQVATSPEFRQLLKRTEWYLVPVSNPDGYSYSFKGGRARMWRKNRKTTNRFLPNRCKGIDLNRNWSLKWGVGASSNPCSDTYKGQTPFSEPETDGLRRLMERLGPFDLFITFHSYGQSVLYPWGWTTEPPSNVRELGIVAQKFGDAVRHASKGKIRYKIGGSADQYGLASGASDDWAYGALRTPLSYTIELRDNGRYGFLLPENQIIDTVKESAVGVYCMASFISNTGVCATHNEIDFELEPRTLTPRYSSSNVIFEE